MLYLFSPLQRTILGHRLEVPDAIADFAQSLLPEDTPDTLREHREQEIYDAAERLRTWVVDNGRLEASLLTEPERFALADAVNGSTYLACMISSGEFSEQRLGQTIFAGEKLAEKVEQITGIPCQYPHH